MKSFLLTKLPVLVLAICAGVCTSCKDDDGEGIKGADAPQGPTVKIDGTLLTNAGNIRFGYDKKGRCTAMDYSDKSSIKIFYDEGEYVKNEYGREGEDRGDISFNERGYISRISTEKSESSEKSSWVRTETTNFTYNSTGNLIAISLNGSYVSLNNGEPSKETWSDEVEFTWSNGNLISAHVVSTGMEDGEVWKEVKEISCTYDKQVNKFRQWSFAMEDAMDNTCEALGFTGMLGIAPVNLISNIKVEEEEKEYDAAGKIISSEAYTHSYVYTYVLNEKNGSILKEGTKWYSYKDFENTTTLAAPVRTVQ